MQTILIKLFVLALLVPAAPVSKTNNLQTGALASGARPQSSETSAIEAYRKMLDSYFKSHPELTRFYVDAVPEGKTDSSPKEWYEVKNENELQDAEGGYANRSIIVSMKDGKIVYVDIGEPMEHSRHDNRYYFRGDGTLGVITADYGSNMEGIHIKRQNLYGPDGHLLRATIQCFNITHTSKGSTEKTASCKKTAMRQELKDYEVPIYKKNSELPGYEILKSR